MYGIFLKPLRAFPIKLFEIGLGCTMKYGAGASVRLWQSWFLHPEFDLWVAEYDKECVEESRAKGSLDGLNIVIFDPLIPIICSFRPALCGSRLHL